MKTIFFILLTNIAFSQIYPTRIHSFTQSKRIDYTQVIQERSVPSKGLVPQKSDNVNDTINFVSLGFGGEILLEFDGYVENNTGYDLEVWETTWGYNNCSIYPERAEVYAGYEWNELRYLGLTCLNSNTQFDLESANLAMCKYVLIKDISPRSNFVQFADKSDGFDLDGIEARYGYVQPLNIFIKSFIAYSKNETIYVEINTASEQDIYGFDIHKSPNMIDWNKVLFIQAIGNTSFGRKYYGSFSNNQSGQIYLRLNVLNFNGEIEYFEVIYLNNDFTFKKSVRYDLLGRECRFGWLE